MTWPQWTLLCTAVLAAVNSVRQALFATATASLFLAVLSGAVVFSAGIALWLLRRRSTHATVALVVFAVIVPLATVLGTERLLGSTLSFVERLPGYLAALGLGSATAWGGMRELATRAR